MSICGGVAGRRGCNPVGMTFHNDDGSADMTADAWANYYATREVKAFAHYHIDSEKVVQCEDDSNCAWHCGNTYGNTMYLSLEVDQSSVTKGTDDATFLKAEDRALRFTAEKFKQYGITPNADTVKLHQEWSATACPERSMLLHGGLEKTKEYFINRIKAYMNGEEDLKGGVTMYATFECKDGKHKGNIYFINLATEKIRYLGHNDIVNIYRKIFKSNTGRELPHYIWSTNDPFYVRIAEGMTSEDVTVKMKKEL